MTFEEHLQDRWQRKPTIEEYRKIVKVIIWNLWQMNGLTETILYGTAEESYYQMDLMELLGIDTESKKENKQPLCRIFDWHGSCSSVEFLSLQRKLK